MTGAFSMETEMVSALFWVGVGIVVKVLVPMPMVDDRVRAAYAWVKNWFVA